ncbi:uncharacterized protein TRAVEDRAFT_27945 [Trametes versicolor FP-101664 SS1]|uniref:uncharacterized protein n=1 Tax=Trametes versicolor (strain FP-101664) TaxID=717944 RepID=UPI000462442E|nr:uncharacterized protein TRAVEDRAFT_27945 [Trametes versicolor FP-101664 SS1]EIW60323.1 hypothetical protein TRAVEDRAFT_27945 [Trametes versicolor FP-101664 SS1]
MRDVHLQPSGRDVEVGCEEHWATSINPLAIAVLLALTLLWLALVAVLGEASWLVLFKVPLGVPTLMLSLELCMGQTLSVSQGFFEDYGPRGT